MDYRMRRRDGVYRWILARGVPRYDDKGEFVGFIGSAIDVTDRRRQESALRQSEERYRAVVDSQTELVCRFTPDTDADVRQRGVLPVSRQAARGAAGFEPDRILARRYTRAARPMRGARAVGRGRRRMGMRDHVPGRKPRLAALDLPGHRRRPAKLPTELQAIGHDITDRKRAEQAHRQLAHTARLAAVGELTAMVAHEVNQPLCAILSNAEAAETLLSRENPPLDQIREIIIDIRNDDLRADEVIRGIRSLVGRREIKILPADLNKTIAHVLRLVSGDAMYRRVRIKRSLDESLPLVAADQAQIEQVLLNLIVNGMDAMHGTPEAERELTVQTRMSDADIVEVAVIDRGCGIPPERLAGAV